MKVNRKILFAVAALAWSVIIAVLSLLPSQKIPETGLWNFDKLAHLFVYAVQTALLIGWFCSDFSNKKVLIYASVLSASVSILFGIVIEISQPVFTNRTFDLYDIFANITGSLTGIAIVKFSILTFK